MEYNTLRKNIKYPEYGRNIEKLIFKISIIKNKIVKNVYIKKLINLMLNINKKIKKKFINYKQKIWIQLFFISNKKIKIKKKYNIKKKILYNNKLKIKNKKKIIKLIKEKLKNKYYNKFLKYYGNNILIFLKFIINFKKIKFIYIYRIVNLMKKNYLKWNKIKFIDDYKIFNDIKKITKGKINLFLYK
ncbi:MAG: DUF4290 domain-containing protein [Candidatus Shikimatogenerans sp. JK-2022]|nr:DUF4290 domain-containing protein [Candidatus Shikimatogenerans bostrichidophilus]